MTTTSGPSRRGIYSHLALILVLMLTAVSFPFFIREGNDWGGDFSVYVWEARNFASHRRFSDTSYVPTHDSVIKHPAVYPPIPSLLLAPVYAARGLDYRAFKLVLGAFFCLSLPFYYVVGLRRGINPTPMAVIILIFVLSPVVLAVGQTVGSDYVYVFMAGLMLAVVSEIYSREWAANRPIISALLTATLLSLCYFTRATGLALIAGFGTFEFRSRPRLHFFKLRVYGLLTIAFTGIALLVYTHFIFNPGQQYGSQFVLQPAVWAKNIISYLRITAVLWGGVTPFVRYPLALLTLVLASIAIFLRLRTPTIIEFCLGASFAVLIVFITSDARYILAVLPFLLMYAFEGLQFVVRGIPALATRNSKVMAICALLALGGSAANLGGVGHGPILEGVTQESFTQLCSFIHTQTPADALLLSWNPRVFALYTGRPSALYPQSGVPAEFERQIPAGGRPFIVFYDRELDRQLLSPYLKYASGRLSLVFQNSDFRVYTFDRHSSYGDTPS